jgi:uncharacterized membrane protein
MAPYDFTIERYDFDDGQLIELGDNVYSDTENIYDISSSMSINISSLYLYPGQIGEYKLEVTNDAENIRTFEVEIEGTKQWAQTRASEGLIVLIPGETKEITVYIQPNEEAPTGEHLLTISVLNTGEEVFSKHIKATVVRDAPATKNLLKYLIFALLIVLVIAMIIAVVERHN